jgi:glycosyltransferase involved in cell wall biosynthesis
VALVCWGYPFDKSPSLQNLARDLAPGHRLDLWVDPRNARGLPPDLAAMLALPPPAAAPAAAGSAYERGAFENLVRRSLPARLRALARELYVARELLLGLPAFVRALRAARTADVVIAADKSSLLACWRAGLVARLYFSLEATPLAEETSIVGRWLNRLETRHVRRHRPMVIAQSPPLPPSDWLRQRHGIAPHQFVLLIAGGLGLDQLTPEIVQAAARWDERLVLVLHSASGRYPPELLELAQQPALAGRVKLSADHFTIDEAEQRVYAGADIGIVYYRDLGFNFRHTAYSSGKLAAFLRGGVPVIVPPFPEFEQAVRDHGYGACATVESIGAVALQLLDHHDTLREAARIAFTGVYQHRPYRGRVATAIQRLLQEPAA